MQIFKNRGHQVDFLKTLPEEELIKIIGEYDGLVVRSATKVMKHLTGREQSTYYFNLNR